jgi:two-component system OmpR family response regulator
MFVFARHDLTLDFPARRAWLGTATVELTAREWVVLEMLATRAGRVLARRELLEQNWGESSERGAASLEVLIGRIRRKLSADLIRTVRGEWYVLECS